MVGAAGASTALPARALDPGLGFALQGLLGKQDGRWWRQSISWSRHWCQLGAGAGLAPGAPSIWRHGQGNGGCLPGKTKEPPPTPRLHPLVQQPPCELAPSPGARSRCSGPRKPPHSVVTTISPGSSARGAGGRARPAPVPDRAPLPGSVMHVWGVCHTWPGCGLHFPAGIWGKLVGQLPPRPALGRGSPGANPSPDSPEVGSLAPHLTAPGARAGQRACGDVGRGRGGCGAFPERLEPALPLPLL